MKLSRHTKVAAAVAGAASVALLASACTSGASAEGDSDITLTITTFGTFGYDDLYAEYEAANPGITIEATNIDTGGNARTDAFTKIAAGSGLSDIVAIEEGWLGAIMEVSDQFVDLRDYGIEDRKSDWVDWKYAQATDPDGRVIGYGTDIGPAGVCYNGALFEAAGLPSDREEVATLLEGDWAHYFEVGKQYADATGKAWYDQSGFVWNSMVNQLDEGYYTSDGELNVDGNAELKERFDLLAGAVGELQDAVLITAGQRGPDGLRRGLRQLDHRTGGAGPEHVDGLVAPGLARPRPQSRRHRSGSAARARAAGPAQ